MNQHVPEEELVQWLDGELPRRRLDAVQEHLAICPECGIKTPAGNKPSPSPS